MAEDFGNFTFDDDEFAAGAGINKVSKAYEALFSYIIEIAEEGKQHAASGASKELAQIVNKFSSKAAALVELSTLSTRIVGANGTIFNVFGQTIDDDDEDGSTSVDQMSEDELIERIDSIIKGCTKISLDEASNEIKKSNIEDDGLSHGDLDGINW